jgi:hypothetical protein
VSLKLTQSAIVPHVASIERAPRLEQHHVHLFRRHWHVLPPRHNAELARSHPQVAIAEADAEAAFHHQEHFVRGLVVVPHELASELHQLDIAVVDFPDDLGAPVLSEEREFFRPD